MENRVRTHYQRYPYPCYPLAASVRRCDTYALNLPTLWACFNRSLPPAAAERVLIAGCGTFSPYPWAVANPATPITALDLSGRALRRARWHCLLHGLRNVDFSCGDLAGLNERHGLFGVIDAYGVLHHLPDPLGGLASLRRRLVPGGVIRLMLYSRYARREEDSIRRAFRLLGIDSPREARRLLRKARPASRLARYVAAADEPATDSGLADALLHPLVHSYRIDEVLELVAGAGLTVLLFAHHGAVAEPPGEIERLRQLERERCSPGNFVLYLGTSREAPVRSCDTWLSLNPCLASLVSPFAFGTRRIPPRIGIDPPPLTSDERKFLRRFTVPVRRDELSTDERLKADHYSKLLFLAEYCR